MTKWTIPALPKTLAALKRAGPLGQQLSEAALREELERIMAASKRLVPVDLGALRASGYVVVATRGRDIRATLGYGGAYAVYIHEGTGPAVGRKAFFPPPEALEAWAKRHGFPPEALFALARAIGRRGLKPRKYLERPLNAARSGMDGRLAGTIRRGLASLGVK